MSLSDYTAISSEQVALLASTLAKRDMPVINQFEPVADFEELFTFSQEHSTPIVYNENHPPWRLESVATRTIEAIALAAHEPLNEFGWDSLAQILIEHAEFLYAFPEEHTARERLTAGTALALVGCVCSTIPQSELWRLAGFGRIALTLNEALPAPLDTHITQPLNGVFSLANAMNLPILDTAIECYCSVLNCNFTSKNALKFPLSDEDFIQYLNLDHQGLQSVKSAVTAGESGLAKVNYTEYRKRYVRSFGELSDLHKADSFKTGKSYLDCLLRLMIYPSPSIYGTTEIAIATLLLPELRIIEQLRRMASRRYKWIADSYFYPDGFHKDRSIRSQIDAISDFSRFLRTYDTVKSEFQFTCIEEMETLLNRQMEACIFLRQPNLSFPPIDANAHSDLNVIKDFNSIDRRLENPSYPLPYTRYYVMRDSWKSDAQYLFFDGGTKEKLSFVLYANGRQLITHEHKRKNAHSTANTPYNVILIDGNRESQESEIIPDPDARWISTSAFDYVEGWYKTSDYQHKRSIFYIKSEYYILHDLILGDGEHQIQQIFHLDTNLLQGTRPHIVSTTGQVLTQEPGQGNLFISSVDATNVRLQFNDGQLTYQKVCELPVKMNVVLFPIKTDVDQPSSVHTLLVETDDDVLASGFTVKSDYGTDIFLISDDGYACMSTAVGEKKIEFRGEYLFLRGDGFVMLNGQYLKVGSEVLVALDELREYHRNL